MDRISYLESRLDSTEDESPTKLGHHLRNVRRDQKCLFEDVRNAGAENNQQKQRIAELEETSNELRAQLDTMVSREQSLRAKLSKKTEEEQRRRAEVGELEQQVSDLRHRLRKEECEHESSRKQNWENDGVVKNLRDEISVLKAAVDSEKQKVEALQAKLKQANENLEAVKSKIAELNGNSKRSLENAKTEIGALKKENHHLRDGKKVADETLSAKESKIRELRQEIAQMKAALRARHEFEKSFADQMVELEEKLEKVNLEKSQIEGMFSSQNQEIQEREQVAFALKEEVNQKSLELEELNEKLKLFEKEQQDCSVQTEDVSVRPILTYSNRRVQTDGDPAEDENELIRLRRKLKEARNEIEVLQTQLRTIGDNEREQKGELESLYAVSEALSEQRDLNFKLREKVDKDFEAMKEMELVLQEFVQQNKALEESLKNWELSAVNEEQDRISIPCQELKHLNENQVKLRELEKILAHIEKEEAKQREKMADETFRSVSYSALFTQNQSTQTNAPEHIIFTSTDTIKRAVSSIVSPNENDDAIEVVNERRRKRIGVLMEMLNLIPKLNRIKLDRGVIEVEDVFLEDCGFASFMCPRKFETSVHAQLQLIISKPNSGLNDRLASVQMENELTIQEILHVIDQDPIIDDLSRSSNQPWNKDLEKMIKIRTKLIFDAWMEKEDAESKLEEVLELYQDRMEDQKSLQNEVRDINDKFQNAIGFRDQDVFAALEELKELKLKDLDVEDLQKKLEEKAEIFNESRENLLDQLKISDLEIEQARLDKVLEGQKWFQKYQALKSEATNTEFELEILKEAVQSLPGGRDLLQRLEVDHQFDRHVNPNPPRVGLEVLQLVNNKYPQIADRLSRYADVKNTFPYNALSLLPSPENVRVVRILNRGSVLVAWTISQPTTDIQGFYVFVDNLKQNTQIGSSERQTAIALRNPERPSLISVQSFSATQTSQMVTVLFPGREHLLSRSEQGSEEETDQLDFDRDLVRRRVASYDYNPLEQSPNENPEMELQFREGDLVTTYGEARPDGFFYGEINGVAGLVPSNFVTDGEN